MSESLDKMSPGLRKRVLAAMARDNAAKAGPKKPPEAPPADWQGEPRRISITLPWPPSANHYWGKAVTDGHLSVYLGRQGKVYRREVKECFRLMDKPVFSEPARLRVEILAFPPDRRTRDLDNLPKALFDAITHARVWDEDRQVGDFRVIRQARKCPYGELLVTIEEIPDVDGQRSLL